MSKLIIKNKAAFFEYIILENYTAGIQLKGSEVKSIRNNNVSISEAYCVVENGEIFIRSMDIQTNKEGGVHNNHEPRRDRKLLLKKNEINKINDKLKQKGLTLIPLSLVLSNTNLIKIEVGLAKGKKTYDKRETIKERDIKIDTNRELVGRN